jgi:hypothetical protein
MMSVCTTDCRKPFFWSAVVMARATGGAETGGVASRASSSGSAWPADALTSARRSAENTAARPGNTCQSSDVPAASNT